MQLKNSPHSPVNPLVVQTESPAILDARAWLSEYKGGSGPALDLSQAAPPYLPAQELVCRLVEAAALPATAQYGPIQGEPELRAAYARYVSTLYRMHIADNRVAITAGCNQAFFIAAMLTARSGDAIILPVPYYFNHKMTLNMLGIATIELPCSNGTNYTPDPKMAAKLIDTRVKAIVLVTPNNPTGAIYPPATIKEFAELCRQRGIWLIIDETYRDFINGRDPPHSLFEDEAGENVISLYSFSKSLALPGYRLGAMIYPSRGAAPAIKIQDCIQICPPRVGQVAAAWALTGLETWRTEKRQELATKARAFVATMDFCAGWKIASMGAYFAYIRHPLSGIHAAEIAKQLAREKGVLLIPGNYFGPNQDQYLRLSFGNLTMETLATLPERLRL